MGESCGDFGQRTLTCSAVAHERISRPASAPSARDHRDGRRDVQVTPQRGVTCWMCCHGDNIKLYYTGVNIFLK